MALKAAVSLQRVALRDVPDRKVERRAATAAKEWLRKAAPVERRAEESLRKAPEVVAKRATEGAEYVPQAPMLGRRAARSIPIGSPLAQKRAIEIQDWNREATRISAKNLTVRKKAVLTQLLSPPLHHLLLPRKHLLPSCLNR